MGPIQTTPAHTLISATQYHTIAQIAEKVVSEHLAQVRPDNPTISPEATAALLKAHAKALNISPTKAMAEIDRMHTKNTRIIIPSP